MINMFSNLIIRLIGLLLDLANIFYSGSCHMNCIYLGANCSTIVGVVILKDLLMN
jgi:hypothetical protein